MAASLNVTSAAVTSAITIFLAMLRPARGRADLGPLRPPLAGVDRFRRVLHRQPLVRGCDRFDWASDRPRHPGGGRLRHLGVVPRNRPRHVFRRGVEAQTRKSGRRPPSVCKNLTGNAAVVIVRKGTQGCGAVARKRGTVHKRQRARREAGEAANSTAHARAEA